ncbi:DUF4325 domain-containing protein [Candidatus Saccharibacteria bacterium]|nr:DUF4325 domain-containing protein [Candidatus Saccharibacteria bacterium]
MKTYKEKIYHILKEKPGLSAQQISEKYAVGDRSYVSKLLSSLIDENRVRQERHGREVIYFVSDCVVLAEENLNLVGLHEDEIWTKIRQSTSELQHLSENAENILYFAFTEMLNNAIDHSRSGVGYIKIWLEKGNIKFIVRDKGVGVFNNVMVSRHLDNEIDAATELIKGKLTTQPGWHSGEGIFWTSKVADRFSLKSYDYQLILDNVIKDYTITKNKASLIGTEVEFTIAADTTKSLQQLFREYSFDHSKLTLDTTVIPIRLFESGDIWISRSQAKKVLAGLDKYKKIIFDFAGIKVIGQAFADEIFRVFNIHHPEIELEAINMSESVALMVARAKNDPTGRH